MTNPRQLAHPPVIEALLNFQANAVAGWNGEGMEQKAKVLFPTHSKVQMLQEINVQFTGGKEEGGVAHAPIQGFMLRSSLVPTVHQVRRDGYAFSQLKPYTNWEAFVEAAMNGWRIYSDAFKPGELQRVALRFINRLDFPLDEFRQNRDEFLTIAPRVPAGLDWGFAGFQQGNVYAPADSPCLVKVQLMRVIEAGNTASAAILLDTEVVLKEPLAALDLTVSQVLLEMRRLKNDAFFGILTPKALERYV